MSNSNYNIYDRIKQLYGVTPFNPNPQESAASPDESTSSQNITFNLPPPDPRLMKEAESNISGLGDYTKKFPNQEDYKPSRLRQILSDIAGVGEGALTFNPLLGMKVASNIKQAPYTEAINRYNMAEQPFKERADIGMNQAKLAGMSSESLYRMLMANAARERVGVEQQNVDINRLKATAPTPFGTSVIGEPTSPSGPFQTTQYGRMFDPTTRQFSVAPITHGISTALTMDQRLMLQNIKDKNAMARAIMGHKMTASDADARFIASQTAQITNELNNSDWEAVMKKMAGTNPDLVTLQQIKDPTTGIVTSSFTINPDKKEQFAKEYLNEGTQYLAHKNLSRKSAIQEFINKKNPLVTGFTPDKR
jgi:hypothetical protein